MQTHMILICQQVKLHAWECTLPHEPEYDDKFFRFFSDKKKTLWYLFFFILNKKKKWNIYNTIDKPTIT